jgi:hypothetical protein
VLSWDHGNVLRSPSKGFFFTFVVTVFITVAVLLAITAIRHHTCLTETQADPLGGLSPAAVPTKCGSQFRIHILESLGISILVGLLLASPVALWLSGRRRTASLAARA